VTALSQEQLTDALQTHLCLLMLARQIEIDPTIAQHITVHVAPDDPFEAAMRDYYAADGAPPSAMLKREAR
jgi:hypothetical protein